jgi:hypothetical protein
LLFWVRGCGVVGCGRGRGAGAAGGGGGRGWQGGKMGVSSPR